MLTVNVLGSGSGRPTASRDTTSLLVRGPDGPTLVDCPGGVVHKLARRGVGLADLRRLILTHDHVDHVYGLPHLLHAMAVHNADVPDGRIESLTLHAPEQTLGTVAELVVALRLDREGYPEIDPRPVPVEEGIVVAEAEGLSVRGAPARHSRDTVALRFDTDLASVAWSADTLPSEPFARLAGGVQLLFHDCGGLHREGERPHASAREAGEVAAAAGAASLRLIHLGPEASTDVAALVAEAREAFGGAVDVASDGDIHHLPPAG